MSNQAVSVAEDLMVGAGELYFRRDGDGNGFHHLGNVEEFTITNDVTTVEKNSSMNKRRELMASVSTSIVPSASITMNEYNPYNMALGLYGVENAHTQSAVSISSQSYTVTSVPGIITLTDPDGNRYFDVSNVVVGAGTVTPASTAWTQIGAVTGNITGATISSGTGTNDILTDGDGTQITVEPGIATSTDGINVYVVVSTENTVAGQTNGLVIKVKEGAYGSVQAYTATGSSDTEVFGPTSSGFNITVKVPSAVQATPASASDANNSNFMNWGKFEYTPAASSLVEGVDYIIDAQRLRGGVITIPATSKLNAGDVVTISATVPEASFPTVSGANAGEITGELLFLGDPDIGGNYVIEAWKVAVTPEGDFTGLIGEDFGSFTLSAKFLADYEHHPQYPFYKATMIGKSSGTASTGGIYDPKY